MSRLQDALSRLEKAPAWVLGALALVLRLGFSLRQGSAFAQVDEHGFDGAAWSLAAFGVIGDAGVPAVRPPLPTAFIASFYALLGRDLLYPRLGQAFVGAATAWLIGRMTEELTGSRRAGRAAFLLAAVYPFFIYYAGVLLSETPYLLFAVPGVWLLCPREEARGGARRAALGGFCLALAGLCRIEAVPIALLIWAWLGLRALQRRAPLRRLGAALACWLLPLLLWGARNQVRTGEFTLDAHGGITILVGTAAYELAEEKDSADAFKYIEAMPFYAEADKLPPAQRDAVFRREALKFMLANPGRTLVQWGKKFVSFWRFYPRVDKVYLEAEGVARPSAGLSRKVLVAISLLFEPWLILGGLLGLWRLVKARPSLAPIPLFILGTMGVHVLIVSMMRYRMPVMPFLILGVCALVFRPSAPSGNAGHLSR